MSGIHSQNNLGWPSYFSFDILLFFHSYLCHSSCLIIGSIASWSCKIFINDVFTCPFMSLVTMHDLWFLSDDTTTCILVKILGYLEIIPLGLIIDYILAWFMREKPYNIVMTCAISEHASMPHHSFSSFVGTFSIFLAYFIIIYFMLSHFGILFIITLCLCRFYFAFIMFALSSFYQNCILFIFWKLT